MKTVLTILTTIAIILLLGCASHHPSCTHELTPSNWSVFHNYASITILDDYKVGFVLTSNLDTTKGIYTFTPYFEVIPKYKIGTERPIDNNELILGNMRLTNDSLNISIDLQIDSVYSRDATIGDYSCNLDRITLHTFNLDSFPPDLNLSYDARILKRKEGVERRNSHFELALQPFMVATDTYQWSRPEYTGPHFCPMSTISFSLSEKQPMTLTIYNIGGYVVKTISCDSLEAGDHTIEWDMTDPNGIAAPSGIYFYKITTPDTTVTKKMILLR